MGQVVRDIGSQACRCRVKRVQEIYFRHPKLQSVCPAFFFVKDPCVRVQFLWIHGACHWPKGDPWRYFHSFSRPNEPVDIAMEWLAKQHEAASTRAAATTTTKQTYQCVTKARGRLLIV